MARHNLALLLLDGVYAIVKLDCNAAIPPWTTNTNFVSITRTMDELSIVCLERLIPNQCAAERGWCAIRVAGQISFSTVGVLASLTDPLAQAGISLFAISTFNTDYLLVKRTDLDRTIEVLRRYGHSISNEKPLESGTES